ncbi:MAG: cytochrome P450 [Bacteroidetes bacterium]|nr:cytochrome P450 [Bacteroidota bacterium]
MLRLTIPPGMPPAPPGNWLSGTASAFSRDPVAYINRYSPVYAPVWTMMARLRKVVLLNDPVWVKYVLAENNKNYTKSFGYDLLRPLLGNGLLTSEGEFWMSQRRLMQPAFHKQAILTFVEVMLEEGQRCAERFRQAADRGETLNISAEMSRVTMVIVSRCLLGMLVPGDLDRISASLELANRDANHRIQHPFALPMKVPTPGNLKVRRALAELDRTINGIIADRRRSGERGTDLLSMLLEARDADTGEAMSDRQLRDEIATIFIAGHETTANALSWTLYALATNPEVEQKLCSEIDAAGAGAADPAGLPYVRLVARESLRLYPPAWIVGREPIADDTIAGYTIPAGTSVLMPTVCIQRNPEFWPDPLAFKPERHEEERVKDLPKYAYFPFGGGPRICIGINFAWMELFLLLPLLMQGLRYRTVSNAAPALEHLITLHPRGGMMLKPERR